MDHIGNYNTLRYNKENLYTLQSSSTSEVALLSGEGVGVGHGWYITTSGGVCSKQLPLGQWLFSSFYTFNFFWWW